MMRFIRNHFLFGFLILAEFPIFLSGCASQPLTHVAGPSSMAAGPSVATANLLSLASAPQTAYHEVGPMETLWRIAKEYDVDINTLMQVNRISNPNQIKVGQKLKIPGTVGLRPVIPLYRSRPWSYIVIHHTATEMGNAISINKAHHERGFWDGLGYHFLIDNGTLGKLDGQIEISPRWVKQKDGAHCNAAGMNQKGVGVALVGNFSQTSVSSRQLDSLVFLVSTLMKHYQIPLKHIIAHRDVPGKNTECPGTRFPWNEFISRLQKFTRR
ncbi:MAG: N-acetylmuramoyl-L-alanine amidase [Candidatus Omnitrophica bacterium]|nr:N-acetylmuramoyl-L-alanine amidase [Candidatus Omnitrophota bacterium]